MRRALVLGAGGFIGSHMVNRLKSEGYWVRGIDLKEPEFSTTTADEFIIRDLRNQQAVRESLSLGAPEYAFDEIYQFAADMGGAGYIFTGENDANVIISRINRKIKSAVGESLYNFYYILDF
jgi:nucleoside-diphosphate-sugar epimerase